MSAQQDVAPVYVVPTLSVGDEADGAVRSPASHGLQDVLTDALALSGMIVLAEL